MTNEIKKKYEQEKSNYIELLAKLDTLSPLKTMARGYTIVQKDGKIINSASKLNKGDILELKFFDGKKLAEIK